MAVIRVWESTVKLRAGLVPKRTEVAPVNPLPVMVTEVLSETTPELGLIDVTTGSVSYLIRSDKLMVVKPPGVVTTTWTVPSPAGAMTLSSVFEIETIFPGFLGPKSTAVVPVNPLPVMVIKVPPARGTKAGLTLVTTGIDL
jgi:hypothetical protein